MRQRAVSWCSGDGDEYLLEAVELLCTDIKAVLRNRLRSESWLALVGIIVIRNCCTLRKKVVTLLRVL